MVERLNRQLNAALRAAAPAHWTEALSLALLGIRSALKQDMGCSTAELVYGAPLRLPGELIAPSATAPPTPASFTASLQRTMVALRTRRPVVRAARPGARLARVLASRRREAATPPLPPGTMVRTASWPEHKKLSPRTAAAARTSSPGTG